MATPQQQNDDWATYLGHITDIDRALASEGIHCECTQARGQIFDNSWYTADEIASGAPTHGEDGCPGIQFLRPYSQDGKRIWLCSCCHGFEAVLPREAVLS